MRALTLYAAIAGCFLWLIVSLGGIGGAIYIGNVLDAAFGAKTGWGAAPGQVLMFTLIIVCWAGPVTVALNFRRFFSAVRDFDDRARRHTGEYLVSAALALAALAVVNAVALNFVGFDLVYGLALAAAVVANIGLIWVCLSIRKAR